MYKQGNSVRDKAMVLWGNFVWRPFVIEKGWGRMKKGMNGSTNACVHKEVHY